MTITYHREMTQGRLREILHYNKRTGIMTWIAAPKYHPRMLGKVAGSARLSRNGKYYVRVKVDGGNYALSRLAFLWVTGNWPKDQIDHRNGDSLDNRWGNLREATQMENCWNHKTRAKNSSTPMGIRKLPSGKFQCRITKNKVPHCIGTFSTLDAAVLVYTKKRKEFFGEFA